MEVFCVYKAKGDLKKVTFIQYKLSLGYLFYQEEMG